MSIYCFSENTLDSICTQLAATDEQIKSVLDEYGHPPYWIRPNNFESLALTIIEQQVSLASAYATYQKLKNRLQVFYPQTLLQLSDEDMRSCAVTRQKMNYLRILATSIIDGQVNLEQFELEENDVIRMKLKQLKGIGDWTVDIYLLHALKRSDIFPIGDLALINAIRMVYNIPHLTKETILDMSNRWKPYRSIATMIFWHYYINKRNIKILH